MSKVIQIRDVPDEVHAQLEAKAKARRMSLSAYLREVLEREAARPTFAEALANIGGIAPHITREDIVSALQEGRAGL